MGGGLMQLVASGAQDIHLTGNPQTTFFKVVYRRHTNFAVESIEQTFNSQADFGKRVTATISHNGDLIQQMYLEVVLPSGTYTGGDKPFWTYGVGNAMVKQAQIEIGGMPIDWHYGEWMDIWTELTVPEGKRKGYDDMVGNWFLKNRDSGSQETYAYIDYSYKIYVPFQFWFNRNPGLALPLLALRNQDVKLNLELRPETDLYNVDPDNTQSTVTLSQRPTIKLFVDYVYLDTDERRQFRQGSHEYLIEQVQFTGDEIITASTTIKNVTLPFNQPVKELIWVHVSDNHATSSNQSTGNRWLNFAPYRDSYVPECDSFGSATLLFNGYDRFSVRDASYFRKVQNYEHHSRVPRTVDFNTWNSNIGPSLYKYIYSYSFALFPEEHQPSGTCNFSRIDNAVLRLNYDYNVANTFDSTLTNPTIDATNGNADNPLILKVFAVNYNILRIMSGMGGLVY